MMNKKAMGLHWYVLLLALIICLGIIIYSITMVSIPKVGEFSRSMIKTLESNSITPTIIEEIMKWINGMAANKFGEHEVFKLRTFCESPSYKSKINEKSFIDANGKLGIIGKTRNCFVDEDDLIEYSEETFDQEYDQFKSQTADNFNLDLSSTIYTSSVKKEDEEYSNIVNTSNGIEIPINIKKKEIGKIIMKPVFKFPVDYDFDAPEEERCILSVDCGATCDDVIAKYSEIRFEKKTYPCDEYFFCMLSFPDDFEKPYPCGSQYFCMEDGANSLACPDCHCLDDWRFIESCDPYGVPQYRTQERTCKHKDLCPDSMKFREVYDCCGYSYKSCGCGGDDCCIPYTGQEYCNRCEPCNCNYGNLCGPCRHTPCPPPPPPPEP